MSVLIVNPTIGGSPYTSEKRAMRFVRQGLADRLEDGTLRFIVEEPRCSRLRLATDGLEGLPTVSELRSYPVAGDAIRVLMIASGRETDRRLRARQAERRAVREQTSSA